MANFKKMILIPYEKDEMAQATRRSELDVQMLNILKRTDLDDRAKFRMYQRLLELYLRHGESRQNNKLFKSNEEQSTQTVTMMNDVNVQTSPENSPSQMNTIIDHESDYQYDNFNSFNFDKYGMPTESNKPKVSFSSLFQRYKQPLLSLPQGTESKIKKKLDEEYNDATPKKPAVVDTSPLLNETAVKINESIIQPLTYLDETKSKITLTPDKTIHQIDTYSPVEKSMSAIKTPYVNPSNVTQRDKLYEWEVVTDKKKEREKKKKENNNTTSNHNFQNNSRNYKSNNSSKYNNKNNNSGKKSFY